MKPHLHLPPYLDPCLRFFVFLPAGLEEGRTVAFPIRLLRVRVLQRHGVRPQRWPVSYPIVILALAGLFHRTLLRERVSHEGRRLFRLVAHS